MTKDLYFTHSMLCNIKYKLCNIIPKNSTLDVNVENEISTMTSIRMVQSKHFDLKVEVKESFDLVLHSTNST